MKRAQSHVEVMVSFVIFIGFLLFIFIFLNPLSRTEESNYVMDNIQKAIINNITSEVGKLSIILNESGTCYNFSDDYGNKYKEVLDETNKYTVYFYQTFSDNTKNINCNPSNYTLGVYSKEEMIIYNKILDLKDSYDGNYDNLKKSLGITNDLLFKTKNLIGEEVQELSVNKNVPGGIDVESREIPMRVINNSGQIQELILNIMAW